MEAEREDAEAAAEEALVGAALEALEIPDPPVEPEYDPHSDGPLRRLS